MIELTEIRGELPDGPRSSVERVKESLDQTKQVIAIEVDPGALTEYAWAMIDCVEAHLAKRLNGIVYAPGDGFFDERLRPILAMP